MAMPQQYPPMDRQRLLFMLMLMQAQQGQQGAQAQGQGPSKIDQAIKALRQGKKAYDDGKQLYNLGSNVYNYFAGPSYTPGAQAAWNEAAGQLSQQTWNAGADAASGISAPPSSPGTATPGTNYAGWAAAAMSAYNSAQQVMDKNARDEQKAYDAALAVPRAVGAYYTAGLSTLAEGFARKQWGGTMKKVDKVLQATMPVMWASKLWTSDKWKTEGNRLKGLIDRGINIPEEMRAAMYQTRGRKKSELINPYLPQDFRGETPQYGWVNNKFANSRNESDLTGRDIWGYSAFFDKYGNDWLGKFSEKQREDIANRAIQRGAVREHHGTIDINWTPELDTEIGTITGGNKIPKAQPTAPQVTQPQTTPPVTATNANRKGILGRLR